MSASPDFLSQWFSEPRHLVQVLFVVALLVFCLVKFIRWRRRGAAVEWYTAEEISRFSDAAEKALGKSSNIFVEKESPDIRVDILMIPPGEHCPFYTLCTMGVGAHRMTVPPTDGMELQIDGGTVDLRPLVFPGWDRVELMMYLPADWVPLWMEEGATEEEIERSYWPILWMKNFARGMVAMDWWYAFSHTVNPEVKLGDFSAFLLASPLPDCTKPGFTLTVGDKNVSVLQLVPITESEYESARKGDPNTWVKEFLPGTPEEMREFLAERVQRMGVVPRKPKP